MILALIGSIIFVLIGAKFAINPESIISPIFKNKILIQLVGYAAVSFFGYTTIAIIKKLFDKKIGVVINEKGIIDNTSGSEIGLIEWKDITNIRISNVMSTRFLLLDTDNSQKYLERKPKLKANMKLYGTPIVISSVSLKSNFDELEQIIRNEFIKHKMPNS
jgi:hypothetical protein